MSCFCKKGYAQTQIADIAAKARVAQGTFYVHFSSKEKLIEELLVEFNQGLAAKLNPIWSGSRPDDLEGLVRRTATVFLDYWSEHRAFVEAYAQRAAIGLSLQSLRDGINPPVAMLLTNALRTMAPGTEPDRIELAAHGLLALWLRIGMQADFNPKIRKSHAEDQLVRMTLGALQGWVESNQREARR